MEAASFTTPAFMTLPNTLSSPDYSTPEPTTIKMEDLQKPQLPLSPPPESQKAAARDDSSPFEMDSPSGNSESKPTKKRKSWGQVLPEPKTNLPPRKRAKTEDEKEQRRIERVKRNRLAAHNSRERKRQEVEALQDEKKTLEDRVHQLEAMLRVYQQHVPDLKMDDFNLELLTPPPSAPSTSPSRADDSASAIVNPRTTSFSSMTPQTSPSLQSIDTPSYSESLPATPAEFPEATVALSDETQHSAVSVGYHQSSALFGKNSSNSSSDPFAHHAQSPAADNAASIYDFFNFSSYDDGLDPINDPEKYANSFLVDAFPGDPDSMDLPNDLGRDLDLLAASGATSIVSDETGIADSI